jgi:hypothetical protein
MAGWIGMNPLMRTAAVVLILFLTAGLGCRSSRRPRLTPEGQVRAVLDEQVRAWNRGDIAGFMQGYAQSGGTRFASGDEVRLGWESVLARYHERYTNRAAMGTLSFEDVDVMMFPHEAALVFGRWRLERAGDSPSGLFTLLFLRTPAGWRIVHDHTSSAAP